MATNYGRDTSCTDDLAPGRMVSGLELVGEALYRRITTPRGTVLGAPNYGIDVRALLGDELSSAEVASIPGVIRGEILKDPRVDTCTVKASYAGGASSSLLLEIKVETGEGPFDLVLKVQDGMVELLKNGAQ